MAINFLKSKIIKKNGADSEEKKEGALPSLTAHIPFHSDKRREAELISRQNIPPQPRYQAQVPRASADHPDSRAFFRNHFPAAPAKLSERQTDEKVKEYFRANNFPEEASAEDANRQLIEHYASRALIRWQAPEFEKNDWSDKHRLIAFAILASIVIYALISNNTIMAITFILIGTVGYLYLGKDPRVLDFMVVPEGVLAGAEIYEFDNIHSFWIFYEPHIKTVSLKVKKGLLAHIHIPVGNEDPTEIRKALLKFIPEEKQEMSVIDVIEKYLRI